MTLLLHILQGLFLKSELFLHYQKIASLLNPRYFRWMISTMNSLYFRGWTTMSAHIENEVTGPDMSIYTYKHSINLHVEDRVTASKWSIPSANSFYYVNVSFKFKHLKCLYYDTFHFGLSEQTLKKNRCFLSLVQSLTTLTILENL